MSRAGFDEVLSLYKSALRETNLVKDDVLAKANPELPRDVWYQVSISLKLRLSSCSPACPVSEKGVTVMILDALAHAQRVTSIHSS